MSEELEFHQNRIRMLASQLADSLEFLTQTEQRNNAAHKLMDRSNQLLAEVGLKFQEDSADALAALKNAVEQSPAQLAEAVEHLAAKTAQGAVVKATAGLVAATKDAVEASVKLNEQVSSQAQNIAIYTAIAALVGGGVGGLAVAAVAHLMQRA